MDNEREIIEGLTSEQVLSSRIQHGKNQVGYKKEIPFVRFLKSTFSQPMVLLLLVAAIIYSIYSQFSDALFLSAAIVLIGTISFYQDARSRNALLKLEEFTAPLCKVKRDGVEQDIKVEEIVVGDVIIIEEGTSIPADGIIIQSNDFSVNESVLTGESMAVFKSMQSENNEVFLGTTAASGRAVIRINAIGAQTRLGKIGTSLRDIKEERTPLERQINNFVKKMVIGGSVIFVIVWIMNYSITGSITESLLLALTLAMSILPEEIPVAFTTFMALGAWRLIKAGVIVKQMKTVETLGSATVICTDKTGTITQNKMELASLYLPSSNEISDEISDVNPEAAELIATAMWASEPQPFDPMETALHSAYAKNTEGDDRVDFKMVHEYPLSGSPPMMTHIWEDVKSNRIIATKGAPEAIIKVCKLTEEARQAITVAMNTLASKGYRVLGVGVGELTGNHYPDIQQDIQFRFMGLVAFYDPPKENIADVLQSFYKAGIAVKIITGDNALTTGTIAREIGLKGFEKTITGEELIKLSDAELKIAVEEVCVFSRMFPEAKLKIVNALKSNGHIVAMTGDGVNDGPALKTAHIGIAMGKKGTAIAKDASALILVDDDLSKMLDAIAMGRKIYTNLKKAIQYIISIHIPIILIVFLPLALGWIYPNIFTPVHVILLELIMGPTCSIIYENEPSEPDTMLKAPRPFTTTFFNVGELAISVVQGLVITLGLLAVYQLAVTRHYSIDLTRSMVFLTLMVANIFLTLVNRSFYHSLLVTLRYKNPFVLYIIAAAVSLIVLLFMVPFLRRLFYFETLTIEQVAICVMIGAVSALWFEVVKFIKRRRVRSRKDTR